jgi:hypothetical protein
MDRLADRLKEEEDIPQRFHATEHRQELTVGIHTILSLPLKFDIHRSIFLLTVMKRGRLLGKIHIKPWALFGSVKFIQELGEFCIGNPRKIGRRVVKVFLNPNEIDVFLKFGVDFLYESLISQPVIRPSV